MGVRSAMLGFPTVLPPPGPIGMGVVECSGRVYRVLVGFRGFKKGGQKFFG